MRLLFQGITKFLVGLCLAGVLLFLPAGGFQYVNGWLFLVLLFVPILLLGIVLYFKAPELLRKRLNSKETQQTQKAVVGISALLFIGGFVVAGLDYRFGWSVVPSWCVILASVVLLISYALYAEVMRENAYLSRTIEVQENQKVIDTGLYGIVRHPMYSATILLFLSMPLVLGSLISFAVFLIYPFLILIRIKDEEKLLEKELKGYKEYKQKVKYRLVPFIW